jgi:hypothetical protein
MLGPRRKRSSQQSVAIVSIGILAIAVMLGLIAAGYWRYVNDVPPFTPPAVRMPSPNGYTQAAQLVARLSPSQRPRTWPSGTPRELEAQIAPVRPVLRAMRAALRLEWQTPLQLSAGDVSRVLPGYAGFRECTRCFVAEGNLARDRGDDVTAIQRYLDGMELGSKMSQGGGLMGRLVGVACHAIGFASAERLVPSLSARAVPAALQRVRQIRDGWPALADMLESERVMTLAQTTEEYQAMQRQSFLAQVRSIVDENTSVWKAAQMALTPRRVALADLDRCYRECIAASKQPIRRRTKVAMSGDPWAAPTVEILSDLGSGGSHWEIRRETQLILLEVALAVRQHTLQHGASPRQPGEIDRKWLPAIPRDCWGQTVAYRLKNGQSLIYSLGPDGKDDGGQAADPLRLTPQTRGDLVFGQLSSRRTQSGTNGR